MRPVLLEFSDHSTVADGYSSDATGRKIHVNMGWGGHYDDYYYLDQPVNAGGYIFAPSLDMTYRIMPCTGSDCPLDAEAGDSASNALISGSSITRWTLIPTRST